MSSNPWISSGKNGLVISEISSPKSLLRPETKARACVLGTKSSFSITSHTRLAILGFTVLTRLMVRETVAIETFARRAMVRISMRSGNSSEVFFFGAGRSATGPPGNRFLASPDRYPSVFDLIQREQGLFRADQIQRTFTAGQAVATAHRGSGRGEPPRQPATARPNDRSGMRFLNQPTGRGLGKSRPLPEPPAAGRRGNDQYAAENANPFEVQRQRRH